MPTIIPKTGTSKRKTIPPIAYGNPSERKPISDSELTTIVKAFHGKTVGRCFLGPAWITEDGVPCVVLIGKDEKWPRWVRQQGHCGFIAWRWNDAPTTTFSLTAIVTGRTQPPQLRWMRDSEDAVVQTIRQRGVFLATVANSKGEHSGWFEAAFFETRDHMMPPSGKALAHLWDFPTPGIPYSSIHARFDPLRRKPYNDDAADQIPLWREPISDYWKILDYNGPWEADLSHEDKAIAAWGHQAWWNRTLAAGFVQLMLEKQIIDGEPSIFSADGRLLHDHPRRTDIDKIISRYQLLGQLLAALAGPDPNAQQAHESAVAILNDPPSLFAVVDTLFGLISDLDDDAVATTFKTCFEAALRDARITKAGTCRPWLANTPARTLELRTIPLDLKAPLDDIRNFWRTGLEVIDLLDAGHMLTSTDLPVPMDQVCEALSNVSIDGSIDAAEERVQAMLNEAQVARNWSIPWGARVEVNYGPFVAVKIFEMAGEFTCYFLDEMERYFHVAIGLGHQPPRIITHHLVRQRSDDDRHTWNLDAEVTLKLIAAAIVRDFLVVEERESLFSTRAFRRRIRGRDVRTVIYLPRVRYTHPHPDRMELDEIPLVRGRHHVAPHLRRAKTASAAQRFLAQRYGVHVPQGFTFVRPHERGIAGDDARIRIYRSRSASRMIFDAIDTPPVGSRPAWFDFEKDCARLLANRGMRVEHQAARRDGDGGVDLYAVDATHQTWLVQCKCWAAHRPVGPDVIRELEGAIHLADSGTTSTSKGMVITTSTFTAGAITAAAALNFELVDGARLTCLLAGAE